MWEIFSQKTPYYELGDQQRIIKFVYFDNGRPKLKDIKGEVDQEFLDIIEKNWHREPAKRQEFRELIPDLQKLLEKSLK